ncbi:Adenosine kinase [Eufriesea mexicana]|uniref:Adenosine kinase n=1 Tax=Eufriesea mexicana TaxID=516756 RepID=A0A310SHW2_9HYME|nr:PREDICTED: adenosine kinase-like [Eufriesea mexicana]XP_017756995.1 PREDICTED: adenosine kinase-like [Eufriesea mexicana]OAD62368.1 Adenosine kinase [Eufriesea mexicana]
MVEKIPLRKSITKLDVPAIIAFGNPLLDVYVSLKNEDLLKKYNLMVDGETELPHEKMQELLADLQLESEYRVSAGGSAQNSMRILQWLCDETFKNRYTIYCGGLGNDSRGTMLENLVRTAGVDIRYAVHSSLPTGNCIALTTESSRSLVANIGAAGVYTLDDLKKSNLSLDTIKIIYIEGFFLTHSFPVAKELVKQAEERDIIIAFNLNGTYIFNDHHIAICEMVGYANIVFGNAREMEALAQSLNVTYDDVTDIPFLLNSLKRITVNVSNTVNEDWLRHGGVFVMTQGELAPAIAVWGRSQSVQVQPIKPTIPVVDTTGAGDSLVAGFLAGVLAQWKPKHCLEYGCKVASFMVTRLGVMLPDNVPPDLLE